MGSPKAATTTTSPNAAPDASNLIQNASVVANQNPFEAYSGQFVAPMTADQYAALGAITGAPGVAGPYLQNATDLYGNASGMVGAGASYLPGAAGLIDQGASYLPGAAGMISAAPGIFGQSSAYAQQGTTPLQNLIPGLMSPYTQDVVSATQNQFNNQNSVQSNALLGQAIQAGNAFGGDREGIAQAQLANQQQMAEAPVIAGLYNQGFQTALGGAEQQNAEALQAAGIANQTGAGMVGAGSAYGNVGLGLGTLGSQYGNVGLGLGNLGATQAGVGTQYGNLGLSAAGQQLQAGVSGFNASTLEQQTQQAQDTALYNQFLAQQGFPYAQQSWLGQQSAMLYPALGGTSTATPAFNPLSTAVGAGLFGAALPSSSVGGSALTSLFGLSDKRVKENIEPVGKTYSGDTVYRFNFKGDPRTQIGLLAQNVERKTPGVVGHDASGIKYLDYKGATDRAAHKGHFQGGGGVAPFQQGVLTPPNIFGKNPYIPVGNIPHGNISIQTAQAAPEPTFNDFLKAGTKFGSSSKSASQNSNISTIDSTVGGTDSIAVDPEYRGGVVGYDDGGSVDPSSYEYLASIASPLGSELSADRSIEAALSPLRRGGVAGYATDGAVTDDADTTPVDTNINAGVAPLPPAQDVAEVKVAGQDPWAPYMSKIEETEKKYGLPPGYLAQTGRIENASANPSEKSPTGATGLYQFIGSTAKQYHVNPLDANSSIEGAGRYGADIKRALEDAGLPATASNIYLGHNQGIDGAIALLRNPDLPAGVVAKPENIRVNGGNPSAPASQFINKFASKFDDNEGVTTPLAYADTDSGVSPPRQRLAQATGNTKSDASNSIFGRLFGVSQEGNQAIMAAGAAMMAGQSPWAMQNIGRGIMAGMGTYQSAEHLSQVSKKMQADLEREAEQVKHFRAQDVRLGQQTDIAVGQQDIARSREEREAAIPRTIAYDAFKRPIIGIYDTKAKSYVDPTTRQPIDISKAQQTASAQLERTADAMAHYKIPPISPYALSKPESQALMDKVMEKNPDYSAMYYGPMQQTITAFDKGPEAQKLRTFNNSIQHINTLRDLTKALDNPSSVQAINRIKNVFQEQFQGATPPSTFNGVKDIVGQEIVGSIVARGGTAGEREDAQKSLDTAKTTGQLMDLMDHYQEVAAAQVRDLKLQYESATKKAGLNDFDDKLTPESKEVFNKYMEKIESRKKSNTEPAATAAAAPAAKRTLPPDAPAGSILGSKKGIPGYQTPDGKFVPVQ